MPSLAQAASYDVSDAVPEGDCLVALMPDWGGRIWFGTEQGRSGVLDPADGEATSIELGGELANSFAVDERGAYVVTDRAMYLLVAAPGGRVSVAWRTPYDRGSARKPGQLTQGSVTTPTVLPGGLVAFTDNAEPRDVSATGCSLAWTSAEVAPTSVPKVSLANGLVYVWTTRPSRWLVNAWYLTAIDVRTGRTAFSVRTGTGLLSNNHYAAVTLAPDGSAYVATLAGLVRVRDG